MSVFRQAEIAYLESQRLGRIATVRVSGQPHAVPVGFRYNPEMDTIDLASVSPWRPRGIEVRGVAEALVSWGLEGERRSVTVRP
jgi:pyridoxamine 5'-phosphate oxidase family protein